MSCCSFVSNFGGVGGSSGGGSLTTYVIPEQWAQNNVIASQTEVVLECQLSTNFDTYKATKSGSLTGLSTRLTEPITAGTLLVEVIINGLVTNALQILHTAGSNPSGGIATIAFGLLNYVAGDLISVVLTTNGAFLPITTDLEVMVQVSEIN